MKLELQVERVAAAVRGLATPGERKLIAIGGPPGSGKSTVAEAVQRRLGDQGVPCGLVAMDGFHLDNEVLSARGLLARKGAPETFDVEGFLALIRQLSDEGDVPVPIFDRERDCVVQGENWVHATQGHVIVEGNYLFLDAPGWRELASSWTLSVFIKPSLEVLQRRLIQRWLDHGLDPADAKARAHQNDLVNATLVLERSQRSMIDLILD